MTSIPKYWGQVSFHILSFARYNVKRPQMQSYFSFLHTLGQEEGKKKSHVRRKPGKHLANLKMERRRGAGGGPPPPPRLSSAQPATPTGHAPRMTPKRSRPGRREGCGTRQRSGFFTRFSCLFDKRKLSSSIAKVHLWALTPTGAPQLGREIREEAGDSGRVQRWGASGQLQTRAKACSVGCPGSAQPRRPGRPLPQWLLGESPPEGPGQGAVPGRPRGP